jgi:hypothetical protein
MGWIGSCDSSVCLNRKRGWPTHSRIPCPNRCVALVLDDGSYSAVARESHSDVTEPKSGGWIWPIARIAYILLGMTDGIEVARTHADSGQRLLELPREPIDIDANTLDDSAEVEALKA